MSNAALVLAARGSRNQITKELEEQLEEIYQFFDRLRVKQGSSSSSNGCVAGATGARGGVNPAMAARPRKVLTFPQGQQRDWFVPRNAGRVQWCLEADADENALHKHVVSLHRWGIPTFLREQPRPALMKLFMSLEAHVQSSALPQDESTESEFVSTLKEQFVRRVATCSAQAARQLFGDSQPSDIVAVFDASGFSVATGRWKLSFRICFVERAVSVDTAKRARDLLISRLEATALEPQEAWLASLEAVERGQQGSAAIGGYDHGFWERTVDDRAFQKGAQHRLVWCDIAQGDPELPEERPLLPYGLFTLTVQSSTGKVDMEAVKEQNLAEEHWITLGSSWTAQTAPTEFWNVGCARYRDVYSHGQGAGGVSQAAYANGAFGGAGGSCAVRGVPQAAAEAPQQQGTAPVAAAISTSGVSWIPYRSVGGRLYFHNSATSQTVWELQPSQQWKQYHNDNGRPYFHNAVLNQTVWALPDGAETVGPDPPA